MDVLTDILAGIRFTGGIFLDAEFTAPWCVSAKVGPDDCKPFAPIPERIVAYHFVHEGRLLLQVHGQPALSVERGEFVLLPRNDDHRLGTDPTLPTLSADSLIQPGGDGGLATIRYGGGGEVTRVVCGFLGCDRKTDPLMALLPTVIKLTANGDATSGAWIGSSFRYAAQRLAAAADRSPAMLASLAELLFAEALRGYFAGLGEEDRLRLASARDARIARAIAMMKGRLNHRWSAEELARAVAMSRSAFAARFKQTMGTSPMRHLAHERLHAAATRLRGSTDSVARVALECGYESEAAFNRAFRRHWGLPPATWRKLERSETPSALA